MKSLHFDGHGVVFVAVWSSGYIGGSIAASSIAPLAVTLWRFAFSGLVLAAVASWRRERWPRGTGELTAVAVVGVLMFAVQFGALYEGMALGTSAGTTALISCCSPLLVAAASSVIGWDRLHLRQWLGIVVGAAGVVVTLADRVGRPPSVAALVWT